MPGLDLRYRDPTEDPVRKANPVGCMQIPGISLQNRVFEAGLPLYGRPQPQLNGRLRTNISRFRELAHR
jgi:hypothetical protein